MKRTSKPPSHSAGNQNQRAPRPSKQSGPSTPGRSFDGSAGRPIGGQEGRQGGQQGGTACWLYGHHAVEHALRNPQRRCLALYVLAAEVARYKPLLTGACQLEVIEKATLSRLVGESAVHQGVALKTQPLPDVALEDYLTDSPECARILVLDRITDPHNVGAILRSAVAMNVDAVITTRRHTPQSWGTLAKAASGALEYVKLITVTNLARTLESLRESGIWCYGLDGEGDISLHTLDRNRSLALVLGAEGDGLRRLTREHCDGMVHIETTGKIRSLNVSNAAAVALYALRPSP